MGLWLSHEEKLRLERRALRQQSRRLEMDEGALHQRLVELRRIVGSGLLGDSLGRAKAVEIRDIETRIIALQVDRLQLQRMEHTVGRSETQVATAGTLGRVATVIDAVVDGEGRAELQTKLYDLKVGLDTLNDKQRDIGVVANNAMASMKEAANKELDAAVATPEVQEVLAAAADVRHLETIATLPHAATRSTAAAGAAVQSADPDAELVRRLQSLHRA